jgi:MFS family permease
LFAASETSRSETGPVPPPVSSLTQRSAEPQAESASPFSLSPNVRRLGWVAFFNDASTEAAYWLLPQFLVGVLGAGTMAFGLIEGAAETAASFGRLASGILSDRWRRRKPLAAAGYTVANLAKPLLAFSTGWGQVFWIRFADRAAKGFRAPPRDALIADSVPAAQRGAAFGFRQAMDTAGAIAGPLAAALLLPLVGGNVRTVFWLAGVPGVACMALAWFAVQEVRPAAGHAQRSRLGVDFGGHRRELTLMLAALGVFSLGNSSDLFLVLRAENLGVKAQWAPVLGLVFNTVYTALSWPLGRLSDRWPRRRLVVAGYLVYAGVYFGFARSARPAAAWLLFPLYGLYYALTEGVLKAWVADLAPSRSWASVFGIFNWVTAAAALPASVLAGWLWRAYSPAAPFEVSTVLALLAAFLLLMA